MRIKIQGGTAREGDPPLCQSCRRATVARGLRLRDEIIWCDALETRITYPITSCTTYLSRQHPSLYEMEDIAWVLRTDARKRQIGFVQAKALKWHERHVLDED